MQGASNSLRLSHWTVRICQCLTLLFPLTLATHSASSESATDSVNPGRVEGGVWLAGIHDVDFLGGSFQAELYIWWISADPEFEPFETLQVLNGRNWSQRAVNSHVLPDGRYYTAGFLSVTASHDWNLFYYPFDRQSLQITIETPFTEDQLQMVPQHERSVVSEFVDVQGFSVEDLIVSEKIADYTTDFGLGEASNSRFSRLVVEIMLERESRRLVLAILVGFIVANFIALLTFTIDTRELGIRTTMVGSAVFAAIGNAYLLNSHLNPSVGSIIVDRFAVGTFSVILVALICGIFVRTMEQRNRHALAVKSNRIVFAVLFLSAAIFYAMTFNAAMQAG